MRTKKKEIAMATLTEDYVSYETAKLLKEKGFDGTVQLYYNKLGGKIFSSNPITKNCTKVPTLQMAMKWLREVHNCNIEIDTIGQKFLDTLSWRSVIYNIEDDMECYCEDNFKSYEQACEAAIKYCLEHLI